MPRQQQDQREAIQHFAACDVAAYWAQFGFDKDKVYEWVQNGPPKHCRKHDLGQPAATIEGN